jgi:hypothetical protein
MSCGQYIKLWFFLIPATSFSRHSEKAHKKDPSFLMGHRFKKHRSRLAMGLDRELPEPAPNVTNGNRDVRRPAAKAFPIRG